MKWKSEIEDFVAYECNFEKFQVWVAHVSDSWSQRSQLQFGSVLSQNTFFFLVLFLK